LPFSYFSFADSHRFSAGVFRLAKWSVAIFTSAAGLESFKGFQ
jgi:hypothetical protein